jgi:hypothetical protein
MQTDLCVSSVPLVQSSRTEWTTELDGARGGCHLMSSVISTVQSFARKFPSEFQRAVVKYGKCYGVRTVVEGGVLVDLETSIRRRH